MKLKITVDGNVYEVEVEASEPEQPHPTYLPATAQMRTPIAATRGPAPAAPSAETVADETKVCRSPISGVVVRVPAKVGQQIKANDVMMILEAMKMETVITSPIDGKISKVRMNPGDPVQGGQVVIEFE